MQHLIHTPFDGCATRRLFSQDDLNTREVKGQIDRTSLETELKVLFEDDFPKHLFLIQNFIATQENKSIQVFTGMSKGEYVPAFDGAKKR